MSEHGQPEGRAALPASGLTRFASSIESAYKPIYTWLGYVGAAVLGLLVIAMMYSVIGRRFFGAPLPGSADIIEMSLLIMTMTVIGLEHMGHEKMTVDAVANRLPRRFQEVLAPIIYAIAIVILGIAVWQLIVWGIKIQGRGETTPGTLQLPKYPFAYLCALGIFTLIPIYIVRFLNALARVVKR
jgi:TRAP-type C4-dicarboxylate transport system permease small subunit